MTALPALRNFALRQADLPLLVFIALVPVGTQALSRLGGHDTARLVQLLVLACACALYAARQFTPRLASPVPHIAVLAAVATLSGASVAASAIPAMAGRELALFLALAAAVAVTADSLGANARRRAGLAVLAGCGLYAALLCLLAALAVLSRQPLAWTELAVGFDNYRFFNHAQTVALPLLALLALDARRHSASWWVAWFSMVVYATFLVCSGARGTVVALAAASLVAGVVLGANTVWPVIRTLLLAGLAGCLLYALTFHALPNWTGHPLVASPDRSIASLSSDNARLHLWRIALDQILSAPWLGVGPMHYAHYPNPKAAHPHNVYLQVAAEWGLPMLLLLCGMATKGLVRLVLAVRAASSQTVRREGVALFVACIALLADGSVSGNFVMPVAQMWIVLCIAWAVAWTRAQGPAAPRPSPAARSPWAGRLVAGFALAAPLWLIGAVWDEASDLKAHLEHIRRDLVGNAKTNPRFWSHGWF
jgi:O-antigen ligase